VLGVRIQRAQGDVADKGALAQHIRVLTTVASSWKRGEAASKEPARSQLFRLPLISCTAWVFGSSQRSWAVAMRPCAPGLKVTA